MIDYEGRRFRKVRDSGSEAAPVAQYHQQGDLVWAEFAGGDVRRGSLAGTCSADGVVTFAYSMVLDRGEVISGRSVNTPEVLKVLYPGVRPIELGHVVPAELSDDLGTLLRQRTADVLRAVGFGSGIVHCEWIVRDGVPYLVECAGRFAGDGIAELIERAYPIPLVRHFYTLMRGDELPPLPQRAEGAAAVRFLQVEPGEVTAVEGVDEAKALPGVVRRSVTVAPGGTVRELRSSWDRVGSVMACADSPGEAMRLAEKAAAQVRVHSKG